MVIFNFIVLIVAMSIVIDWITQTIGDRDIDGLSAIVIAVAIWYLIQMVGGIKLC
jgi:hypothetical protein